MTPPRGNARQDATERTPDEPWLDRLPEEPSQLLFIMGCHRSGTSLLHHLLAKTGEFDYLSVYDLLHRDELVHNHVHGLEAEVKARLDASLASRNEDRVIDRLPVGAELPEEYRFLFRSRTTGLLRRPRDVFFAPSLTRETRGTFALMCRKKRFVAGEERPLLLKNPNDFYFNFFDVHRMFPRAKFLFIHRHPLHVLNSHVTAWPLMLDRKSDYWSRLEEDYGRMFGVRSAQRLLRKALLRSSFGCRQLAKGLAAGYRHYLSRVRRLPETSYVSIRYEDLCEAPRETMELVGAFLGCDVGSGLADTPIEPRRLPLLPRVERAFERYAGDFARYLEGLEYAA